VPIRPALSSWTPERLVAFALGALWLSLPATTGAALGDALDATSTAVQAVAAVLAWSGWTAGVLALLAPRTVTLTVARFVIPAAVPAAAFALLGAEDSTVLSVAGLTTAALAATLSLMPETGSRFVNGSAYGHERRFPLRAPAAVILGPLEILWAAVVAGVAAGPLLLAAEQWIAGALATAVGAVVVWFGARSAHGLTRRWIVLVPAGLVVHDPMALADTLLVQKRDLARLTVAEASSTAEDLTLGALGLALEIDLRSPADILPMAARRAGRRDPAATPASMSQEVARVLVTPTRPGHLLRAAAAQGLPVG